MKTVLNTEREEFRTPGIPEATPGADRIVGRIVCDPPRLLLPYVAALEAGRSLTLLLSDGTVLDVIGLDWTCGILCAPLRPVVVTSPSSATMAPSAVDQS